MGTATTTTTTTTATGAKVRWVVLNDFGSHGKNQAGTGAAGVRYTIARQANATYTATATAAAKGSKPKVLVNGNFAAAYGACVKANKAKAAAVAKAAATKANKAAAPAAPATAAPAA